MKGPVAFEFVTDDDVDNETVTLLLFTVEGIENINTDEFYDDDEWLDGISDNEMKYGVHDYSTSPPLIDGYSTYEVEPENYMACMEGLRQLYIDRGMVCSEIERHISITYPEAERIVSESVSNEDKAFINKRFWNIPA